MKALTFTSLIALGLVGAACSEAVDPVAETEEIPAEVVETPAPVDDGFNLPNPGDDIPTTTVSDDGFNLSIPASNGNITEDGFNLPSIPESSTGLSDLPEIDTSILEEATEEPQEPDLTIDDEPVIRLD
ncbi:MAG: hypothetical protein AAGB16_00610 [Pseudomonadota bacterium]